MGTATEKILRLTWSDEARTASAEARKNKHGVETDSLQSGDHVQFDGRGNKYARQNEAARGTHQGHYSNGDSKVLHGGQVIRVPRHTITDITKRAAEVVKSRSEGAKYAAKTRVARKAANARGRAYYSKGGLGALYD